MEMHDLLVWTLTQPEEKALLITIVGRKGYNYRLEEPRMFQICDDQGSGIGRELGRPDILIDEKMAIEIEGDIDFNFANSLRQIKKYKTRYPDTKVIIPKICEKFAILYHNENFPVYLWSATRVWECILCCKQIDEKRTVIPKCKDCGGKTKLKDIKDVRIEEYIASI